MKLPAERRADVEALIQDGAVQGQLAYYFPAEGEESADLPDWEWVNLAIAAAAGVGRSSDATLRREFDDHIADVQTDTPHS